MKFVFHKQSITNNLLKKKKNDSVPEKKSNLVPTTKRVYFLKTLT